ncbi:AraC family transcriptional regulator [Zestomonas carbonaria]|uniref:Putative HTH-type transcriptional regulator n=1 Tax=Zestomonas carbonaria TaxID=2762745 RepID=A0A7U7I7U9_9GAMM|nr:AraC family transcriptional regulator [Pseudomonas carbonaria]CAD5106629.1 putative HTH-type transcriptional regulator [Pseudomonas carbonaria]
MTIRTPWYECDSRFIAAHYQPAMLIDLALSREIDSHRLLRGTGLFYEDILAGRRLISPQQFLTLIGNSQRLLDADDTSFLLGQRLLPGHYGAASHALQHAGNLQEALGLLIRLRALLCPLLAPRLLLDEKDAWLYWVDACGAGEQRRFLVETSMTAVAGMSRWLAGERLPWHFHFGHAQPRYVEQYWVHLGDEVLFARQLDAMRIPREYLTRPWPQALQTAGRVAQQESDRQLESLGFGASLLERLYVWLLRHVREAPTLEQAAQAFEMSPATFKRKLHKHGTHYQEQRDLVRKQVALYLYRLKGYGNDEVAAYLRFHDTANFRRSFKRWTGLSPSDLRQLFRT